uniref:Uncharacterized protein n=1 Tax=Strigops habroptila TaxID=2489341 RepID=A0A672U944_STRHB
CRPLISFFSVAKASEKWWRTPVVPATQEAEPAGSLEPRSSGLQCAIGIAPANSHCSVAWAAQRDAGSFFLR